MLSPVVVRNLAELGGVDKPEEKYMPLAVIQADGIEADDLDAVTVESMIEALPEGNAVVFTLYDGAGRVYFDAELAQKTDGFSVETRVSAWELANAVQNEGRYSVGLFVTGAFRETDEQLRILAVSREIALLSELASAGIREIVIVGLPSDSDKAEEVNGYMRQATEVCGNVTLGVAVSTADADSAGISRLVAYTEQYADSYFLDVRDVTQTELTSLTEKNAYFLTAYNMRLMLRGSEREKLIEHVIGYGVTSYVILP